MGVFVVLYRLEHKQELRTMKNQILIISAIFLATTISYGQKKYLNQNNVLDDNDSTLALVPIFSIGEVNTDSLLHTFYSKEYFAQLNLIEPDLIRGQLTNDTLLKLIISKITSQEYSKKEIKQFPGLKTILDSNEMNYLKEKLNKADLILVPIELRFVTTGGYTFGYSRFRLYKINTGKLMLDCPMDFNVNSIDPKAKRNLSIILIGETSIYIRDNVINK